MDLEKLIPVLIVGTILTFDGDLDARDYYIRIGVLPKVNVVEVCKQSDIDSVVQDLDQCIKRYKNAFYKPSRVLNLCAYCGNSDLQPAKKFPLVSNSQLLYSYGKFKINESLPNAYPIQINDFFDQHKNDIFSNLDFSKNSAFCYTQIGDKLGIFTLVFPRQKTFYIPVVNSGDWRVIEDKSSEFDYSNLKDIVELMKSKINLP